MSKLMRKLAMVLAGTLIVEASIPAAKIYAHETVTVKAQTKETTQSTSAKGDLSTTIRFDSPITSAQLEKQEIKVTVKRDNKEIAIISIGQTCKIIKNEGNYTIKGTPKNLEGVEKTTEQLIGSYSIEIKDIEVGTYSFEYEGKGYKTYTTQGIKLEKYSKDITVGTEDGTFAYGDINQDGVIGKEDLEELKKVLQEGSENVDISDKDINEDGEIDIEDITYVKQQLDREGKGQARISDLAAIISQEMIEAAEKAIQDSKVTIQGDKSIAELFTPSSTSSDSSKTSIQFNKKPEAEVLEIPLVLGEEKIEAQTIEFVSPNEKGALEGGKVIVEYYLEDGSTDFMVQDFDISQDGAGTLSRSGEKKTVVINLGKRVPVKSIVISVEKVAGTDEKPQYVVMEQVSFIKDIVSNVSPSDKTMVKNVKVVPQDKAVTLTWDDVPSVEGYKVIYGDKPGNYDKELNVSKNSATVEGLENLKTYYFRVKATSGDWEGTQSEECQAIPQPSKAPLKPDFLKVQQMNGGLTLSWGKTEDATYYKVFYKESDPKDSEYKQFIPAGSSDGRITSLSATIGGLTNNVSYDLHVIAGNSIGESSPSEVATGKPQKIGVEGPVLPKLNRIKVDEIKDVELLIPRNVDMRFYPNGFNLEYDLKDTKDGIKNVVDGDYSTHWTASDWTVSGRIDFTFNNPQEMNYVVFVPRVDEQKYIDTLTRYHITVWEKGDDLSGPGKEIVTDKRCIVRTDKDGKKYMIFEFPKTTVQKIGVRGRMADGGPALHSASEIAFYNYDSLEDEIRALFKDDAFTTLAPGVKQEDITAIREKLESKDSYYVDSHIYMDELDLTEALLEGESKLGIIKSDFISIDASKDAKHINDWSPLGIVGYAGKQMVIYADIPQDETIEIIPTQYYSEADSLAGNAITLTPGRNIIDITKIGSLSTTAGGAFYYRYSGSNGDKVKLHIRSINNSIVQIPTLELYDWYELSEAQIKDKIGTYIDELTAYKPENLPDKETNPKNSTEISGRNILLSLPADQVLIGLRGKNASRDEQIQTLYNSMLAWEEVTEVVHTTYGLDKPLEVLKSRQNIRYMRMFGKAFMYAAGSHIGVGYGSTSALVQGTPTTLLGNAAENGLFGWGIGHEIGHNMDRIGKAEITNNIYSLMLQTYDGKDNTLKSRLELSDKYSEIYQKVAIGDKGMANDVFTQLGMYWQLHLAYDNGKADTERGPLYFYNQLFKLYDSGKVNGFTGDNKFAVAASMVAGKNLTEFFTKWGMDLSDAAKNEMAKYPAEERKVQYLTDESRRYRLNGEKGITNMNFTATATIAGKVKASAVEETSDNKVQITINVDETYKEDLLGFEIFREGKQIAFITGTTYEDILGSANNKAFKYEVRAIDKLGNIVNKSVNDGKVDAGQVRVEHDNVIDKAKYSIQFIEAGADVTTGSAIKTTGPAIVINFKEKTPVTGIRVKAKSGSNLPEGNFVVQVDRQGEKGLEYVTIKKGDFSQNAAVDTTKFITYFNKPGVSSDDTRIWTYDANTICITGEYIDKNFLETFDVEPLGYPGDNVAFEDYKIGKMGQDYTYETQTGTAKIEKGTLVILGSYRGDPLYNTIHIEGKFAEHSGLDEKVNYVTRPINGEVLMFAEVPEDGETSDISDGFFIFIPNVQKEGELHGDCSDVSILPAETMAKMYRYDTVNHTGTPRVTSTTLWYSTPSYDSMPEIILSQGARALMQ